jgi:hypothetical protein
VPGGGHIEESAQIAHSVSDRRQVGKFPISDSDQVGISEYRFRCQGVSCDTPRNFPQLGASKSGPKPAETSKCAGGKIWRDVGAWRVVDHFAVGFLTDCRRSVPAEKSGGRWGRGASRPGSPPAIGELFTALAFVDVNDAVFAGIDLSMG